MKRNVILSAVLLLGVCCVGFFVIGAAGYIVYLASDQSIQDLLAPEGDVLQIEDITLPTSIVPDDLPAGIVGQMQEIERQVIQIRGLFPEKSVDRVLLTSEQLRENVMTDFFSDYTPEDARRDAQVLALFGFLDPEYDLYQLFIDLYSEQIAGYYDSETKEMFVVQVDGFHGPERMTYAHEYTHTLQDQVYDLYNGLQINQDYCEDHTEYCAAVSALVEGDATFTEQEWYFKYSTEQDQKEVQEFYLDYQSPVLDSTPEFLQLDFYFPYQQGLEFVNSLYDRGGWRAVDEAYADPPVSTEQIMHPDAYPDDRPEEVALPDLASLLGDGWDELDDNVMGEWYIYLMLAHGKDLSGRLPEAEARKAAAGWAGDSYAVYQDQSGEFVLVFHSSWEKAQDAEEFFQALEAVWQHRWGSPETSPDQLDWDTIDEGVSRVILAGEDVLWLVAPDSALLERLAGEVELTKE